MYSVKLSVNANLHNLLNCHSFNTAHEAGFKKKKYLKVQFLEHVLHHGTD